MGAAPAGEITGKVTNLTTRQPAAGDEVILLRLGEGMEEAARTRTDAQGAFRFPVDAKSAEYLVRAIHNGVNYDQKAGDGPATDIAVFNAVPKVPGMRGGMGIVQVEGDGETLKLTEMYSITNASQPPVTQAGARNFEFSLPSKATLDSFEVKRASGVWVNVAPAPVAGQAGRFAVDFPLRPGDTLFKYTYRMPYAGAATLRLKLAYPIVNFAVTHPPSMTFKAARPDDFKSLGQAQGVELEAATRPLTGSVPAFEISGLGVAPPHEAAGKPESQPATKAPEAVLSAAPSGSGSNTPAQRNREAWVVGAGLAMLLVVAAIWLWRRSRRAYAEHKPDSEPVVEALQEELHRLEQDKRQGAISDEQYDAARQAVSLSLQRALARTKS